MRLVFLFALAMSCAPVDPIPGYDSAVRCEADSDLCDPAVIADVLDDFGERWHALFDNAAVMPDLIVIEDAIVWGLVDTDGDGGPVTGHASILVSEVHATDLRSLVHELVHHALQVSTGDPDGDHGDGAGPWSADHDLIIKTAVRR
jgi:hypothetical protein